MSASDPQVSVIIPTYNRVHFLAEAIDSVLKQNFSSFELIVVDDGSDDGTSDLVSSFKDPRIKYLYQNNSGVSAARNFGVKTSNASLIAFLDSDDLWLPEKLNVQVNFFNSDEDIAICQTEELWIRNGKRVNPMNKHKKHSGWIFKECLPLCIVSPSAVMMKRKIFDELGGFDKNLPACEDYDLWLKVSLRYPIYTLEDALIIKRGGHDDQLSGLWGLDRYRVKSLLNLLGDTKLDDTQRGMVVDQIKMRSKIVIEGARKRNNSKIVSEYEGIIKQI